MKLWIARHGEADAAGSDDLRALTRNGSEAIGELARAAAARGWRPAIIRHSGKKRALETARILQKQTGGSLVAEPLKLLLPESDPEALLRWIDEQNQDLLLVSHLPLVAGIAEALEAGLPGGRFAPGTILAFERGNGRWLNTGRLASDELQRD
ncbi:MAG TPA: histidine phosphatase family protein [Thermoanaerobaculia bacterium]|nr:histidine phosphatase family protein [Thermoanaerobaculia bacterium]